MADTIKTATLSVDVTKLDAKLRHATQDQRRYIGDLILSALANPAKQATILASEGGTVAKDYGITLTSYT